MIQRQLLPFPPAARRGSPPWALALGVAAAVALLGTAGLATWRIRSAQSLARTSEPFQAFPQGASQSLLIVGDSTAVGTGASGPAASVAGLIASAHPGLRLVNRAADGAKYEDFVRQLLQDSETFDTVLVLGGGNDVIRFTSESALRVSVAKVAALARLRGTRVILMPPGNVGNAPFFFRPLAWLMARRSRMLHAVVREQAQRHGASYVDLYKPRSADPFAQRPRAMHAKDGLHPSDEGYRLWLAELQQQAGATLPA
ncbi:SGNH/GDSL hydrolase family protein [Caenimonas aquaedulcis]|uniref:GDSL family lipase n=1 Tax=Caenimonas aquaedulcis TaxID=2793270 RepID=A0A931H396_9BURK|nr:GDSL-type esterase/lipase family protein [Caenimonas aquaedulcis]MBG9387748.1 GDSL family lipase [Caenimonas aquaedulcis]